MRADIAGGSGEVAEANEANNVLAVPLKVVRPDLTVTVGDRDAGGDAPGANVSVTHVVRNTALAAGCGATTTSRLYLSSDATLDDPGDRCWAT